MADFEKIMQIALPALGGVAGALDSTGRAPRALNNIVSMRTMLRGQEDRRAHMESVENRAEAADERARSRHSTFMEKADRERELLSNLDAQRAELLDMNLPDSIRRAVTAASSSDQIIKIMDQWEKRQKYDKLGAEAKNILGPDSKLAPIADIAPELLGPVFQAMSGREGRNEGRAGMGDFQARIAEARSLGVPTSVSYTGPGGIGMTASVNARDPNAPTQAVERRQAQLLQERDLLDEEYLTSYKAKADRLIEDYNKRMEAIAESGIRKKGSSGSADLWRKKLEKDLEKLAKESKYFARSRELKRIGAGYGIDYETKPIIGPDGPVAPPETSEEAARASEAQAAQEQAQGRPEGVAATGSLSDEYNELKANAASRFGL